MINVLVMLTSPIWALWAAAFKLEKLPGRFSLVHTHDNNIYGMKNEKPKNFFERFKTAMWWICRNPGYGFDAFVFGFPAKGVVVTHVKSKGDISKNSGSYRYKMVTPKGKKYFSYRKDIAWSKSKYLKMWFGWHFMAQGEEPKTHMLKFDINPFKTRVR